MTKRTKAEIAHEKAVKELRNLGVLSREDLKKALQPFTHIPLQDSDVLDYTYDQAMIEAYSNIYTMLEHTSKNQLKTLLVANIRGKLGNIENLKNKYQPKEENGQQETN